MVLLEERHWLETHDKHSKMFTCEMGRGPSLKQISLSPQVCVTHVTHSGDSPSSPVFTPHLRQGGGVASRARSGSFLNVQEGASSMLRLCGHILPSGTCSLSGCCEPRSLLFTGARTGSFSFIVTGQKWCLLAKLVSRKPMGGKVIRNVGGKKQSFQSLPYSATVRAPANSVLFIVHETTRRPNSQNHGTPPIHTCTTNSP